MSTTMEPLDAIAADLAPALATPRRRRFASLARLRPRIGTILAVAGAALFSLTPALLPRTSASQALLTGVLAAVAIGIAGMLRILLRRRRFDIDDMLGGHWVPVLLLSGFVVTTAADRAAHWQDRLRADMGIAPVTPGYWVHCVLGAALVAVVLVAACRGLRWVVRTSTRKRGRRAAAGPAPV